MPPIASFKRSASDADWAGDSASGTPAGDAVVDAKRLKPDPSKSSKAFTHVYLCIDRSGSMNSMDVAASGAGAADNGAANNNGPAAPAAMMMMTRYDAVFSAAAHLVELQKGKGIDFSLILWNDEAEWIFRNRTADESLTLLAEAKTSNPPRLGTNFSNCFKLLRECIVGSNNSSHSSVVIFLSDGRPGDLRCHPPNQGEQIQPTYRRNKQTYDSVGGHLGALEPYLPPGTLHFVGIHESGYPWLQCLAERYNGTFHMSTLHFGQVNNGGGGGGGGGGGDDGQDGVHVPPAGDAMNNAINSGADENEPGNQAAPAAAAAAAAGGANQEDEGNAGDGDNGGNGDDGEEEAALDPNVAVGNKKGNADEDGDDDDDDLEFIEEVSVNERIRRNIANGEVISIASQSQSQSIMDTFSSLSQSISQYHESQQQSQDSDDYYDDDEDPYADDL